MSAKEWNDLLDAALTRLESEPMANILADYPAQAGELQPFLAAATSLETLWPVTMPAAEALAAGREAFLTQVEQLPAMAVSPSPVMRLKGWITNPRTHFSGLPQTSKETKRMNALLVKAALALILFFGAAGGTAVASANSLPDSMLYPVKLAMEDTRLALTSDPIKEAELNLALTETRLEEITEMSLAGKEPDEAVLIRFENHYDAALRLAAQMPDDAMAGFLIQVQDRVRIQANDLVQTRARVSGPGAEALDGANGLLNRLRLRVEDGLQEPQQFRQHQGNMPADTPQQQGPCNNGDCEPAGNSNQHGQDPTNEGQNGPSYGDGCLSPDGCEPAGNANQYGQDPTNDGQNGPSYGDGCLSPDGCEPAGDANQYGQDPSSESQNGPGDGCPNPDGCEPAGDANQYGQDPSSESQNGPGDGDGVCNNNSAECNPVGDANQHNQ